MIRRHATGLRIALMALDAGLAVAVTIGVYRIIYGSDPMGAGDHVDAPGLLLATYALVWVWCLDVKGLYRLRARWSVRSEAVAVTQAAVILALGTMVVLHVTGLDGLGRAVLVIFPIQAVASLVARAALRSVLREARRRGRNLRSMLIVGTGPSALAFERRLAEHWDIGLSVEGFLGPAEEGAALGTRYLGEIERLPLLLHERVIDEVAICLPNATSSEVEELAAMSMAEGATVRIPTELPSHLLSTGHVEDLEDRPVLTLISGPDRTLGLAAKRVLDVCGATVGLIVLSPLLLAVAVAIFLTDGRPILFRQPRAGLHGRTFMFVKFRTMVRDADSQRAALRQFNEVRGNAAFKMANDPRITRIGRLLRRTSIDEFPQLWNVLRGEMSLVGPRPHPLDDVAGYDAWHHRRLTMKPGMTGLWQIAGRREHDFDRWVRFDLEYIDHWSLWLDLRLLIRTIPALLRAEGR